MSTNPDHVEQLAAILREVDGGHSKGAAALAQAILGHPGSAWHPPDNLAQSEEEARLYDLISKLLRPRHPVAPERGGRPPMPEYLSDMPRYIIQDEDGSWSGADDREGPWRPISAPQSGLPWKTDGPAPATITPADRLALAVCRSIGYPGPCHASQICNRCRQQAAAVAHELAAILRERHGGSSQVADWLDGVGCHPRTVQTVQEGQ